MWGVYASGKLREGSSSANCGAANCGWFLGSILECIEHLRQLCITGLLCWHTDPELELCGNVLDVLMCVHGDIIAQMHLASLRVCDIVEWLMVLVL